MPIPEPAIYRPSNLTKQQKHEQLAACYGVPVTNELSFEEVERMRQIVQMHDAERQPMQTIDLNNPKREQYRFQKFPMMVYGGERGQRIIVKSETELQSALAQGWSQEVPIAPEERDDQLSPALRREVEQVEERLEEARSRRRKGTEAA